VELRLYDHTAPATLLGLPVAAAMTGYRRAKRLVKQTPMLWRAFCKARSAVAGYLASRGS
jgi:CelD/BcsL family acetyltransferase involved in cellulose biosynthesis